MDNRFTTQHRRKAVTIFSGIGSSSLALRNLGYHVIPHDKMPEAVQTLKANGFSSATEISVVDIDWSEERYEGTEMLVGGPPCQPFSQSHDGDGRYDERDMIPEFVRAVAQLFPSVFIMEEVQTLTWKRHADYLERVESDLRALGYVVEHRILNSAEYTGVGQARKRLFVVGVRVDVAEGWAQWGCPDAVQWPEKIHGKPVTMAERLGWDIDECIRRNQQAPEAARVNGSADNLEKALWPLDRPSTTVVGSFRPDVQAAPGYRKAGDGPRQNTPGSVVTTFEERLRLQGLPPTWVVKGSQAKRDLQVGNSCPTPLLEALIDVNIP